MQIEDLVRKGEMTGGLKVGESAPNKTWGAVKQKKVKCIHKELGKKFGVGILVSNDSLL